MDTVLLIHPPPSEAPSICFNIFLALFLISLEYKCWLVSYLLYLSLITSSHHQTKFMYTHRYVTTYTQTHTHIHTFVMALLNRTFLATLALLLLSILTGQVNGAPAYKTLGSPSAGLGVPIMNPDAKDIIPSSYIVVYHDHIDDDKVAAHQAYWAATIAKRNIGKRSPVNNRRLSSAVRTFSIGSLRAMALEADDASAIEINNADEVHYIEADTRIHLSSVVTQHNATSGLARLSSSRPGATSYTYHDSAGAGITVFVVDTGIKADHEDFEGRAFMAFNGIDDDDTDGNGHGSHVAGTIGGKTFGVAKKVTLYGVKVLGADGTGTMSSVLTGVEFGTYLGYPATVFPSTHVTFCANPTTNRQTN